MTKDTGKQFMSAAPASASGNTKVLLHTTAPVPTEAYVCHISDIVMKRDPVSHYNDRLYLLVSRNNRSI